MRSNITHPTSDVDLATRIGIAFATRPRISWHDIEVTVRSGIVTLEGEVPSYYDRQLVVAVTRHVAGVFGINDQITVVERTAKGRRRLLAGVASIGIAILTMTGCGVDSSRVPVHPVSGAIQFRGQPIAGAFVSLHAKDAESAVAPTPRATVGSDGKFSLSTYEGQDGAPEGDYVLTVQWYKPIRQGNDLVGGPNVLPPKYAAARTSDVVIKVAAGENHLQPIQLR